MRQELPKALLVGAAGTALYLSLLTKRYVFEGLARAMPIDLGLFPEVFKGTYLLYGFLGWCFHKVVQAPLAVVSLQIMDALIGGAGLSLFYVSLRKLELDERRAFVWTAGLALSLGYWMWSTDAQVYIFSCFTLIACWLALVSKAPVWAVGLLHGLAILAHVVNGVFGLVVLTMLPRKDWARYAAGVSALVALAYAAALAVVRPDNVWLWLLGTSFAGEGKPIWQGSLSLTSLWTWARMTVEVIVVPGTARLLLLGAALYAALRVRYRPPLVWLGAYALVFTSWQPHTMIYRVTDLPALFTLLAVGTRNVPVAAPAIVVAVMAAANYQAELKPRADASTNPLLARMEQVKRDTPADAWVAVAPNQGGGLELYLPYFAQRKPLVLERLKGPLPQPLYALPEALEDPYWGPYLSSTTSISSTGSVLRLKGRKPKTLE